MAASAEVQSAASISSRFWKNGRMMTRFERQVLWMIIVAAALFAALTWRLFTTI